MLEWCGGCKAGTADGAPHLLLGGLRRVQVVGVVQAVRRLLALVHVLPEGPPVDRLLVLLLVLVIFILIPLHICSTLEQLS